MPRAGCASTPVSRPAVRRPCALRRARGAAGFSLVEMVVTLTVLAIVVASLSAVLIHATLARMSSSNRFESLQTARSALDMIARDLRCAGYGVDASNGAGTQPAIAYVDSMQVVMCENQQPYPDASGTGLPQAYDPSGLPRPQPLVGSAWTPPVKYGTGAELIRYTLDLNDDGLVDASDIAATEGADARRTRQPADYTLVRAVYGDRSGGVAGNNGGSPERIALVMKPGNGVLPLFNVYLGSSTTPWNWSQGAVPANQLSQITRVEVNVTASSANPDARGTYTITPLVNQVLLQRNTPDFGGSTYTVDGWVYQDANANRSRDNGEAGLAGATVRLGNGRVVYTNAAGYYAFRVPAGNYLLKHVPPAGYGSYSNPDSFSLNVASATTRSFADTTRTGGWITVNVFDDTDGNGLWGAGESGLGAVNLTLAPAGTGAATNASGIGTLFAATGNWTVSAALPTDYTYTTTNPVAVSMAAGGTATVSIGMRKTPTATIAGRVFWDKNDDGAYGGTDAGVANVVVSAKDASGLSTIATATTDANGAYTLTVPAANGGTTYRVTCPGQPGCFATTTLAYTGVTVTPAQALTGKDFGFGKWTASSITTGCVTCLAAADLWDDDNGGWLTTRRDVDLVVGNNSGSGGAVGVWANAYPTATPFSGTALANISWWTTTAPVVCVADSACNLVKPSAPYPMFGYPAFTYGGAQWNWGWANRVTNQGWPTTYTQLGDIELTSLGGTVQAMVLYDTDNGGVNDVIVGGKSNTSGQGGFEVWHGNTSNGTLSWTPADVYPTLGGVPGQKMGEVNAMALGDIDGDGKRDLVVATQTTSTSGSVMVFKFNGPGGAELFTLQQTISFANEAPKAVVVGDLDGDGWNDLVIGTQTSSTTGDVYVEHNYSAKLSWLFSQTQTFKANGAVTAMGIANFGGTSAPDVVVGYGSNTVNVLGGVTVYGNQGGLLDSNGIDPTNGTLTRWVTALALANFNYGTSPSTPSAPYHTDMAIGWKQSSTAGGVMTLVR